MDKRPLLMIHGYNHDPDRAEHSPFRPGGNFDLWPKIFTNHTPEFVPWYSAIKWVDTDLARDAGHWNTYRWSYLDLAEKAASALETALLTRTGLDVVAHSLGTRVVLLAVQRQPECFRRVLLLNGAEIWRKAIPIIETSPSVDFLNIAVREDDVLARMGALAAPGDGPKHCIGNGCPAGMRRLPNFREVVLDDDYDQRYFADRYGFDDLEGDGPSYGDHSFSFVHEGNHALYRAFFAGEL